MGVGEAFGAEVINTNGSWPGVGAVAQDASRSDDRMIYPRVDAFMSMNGNIQ